MTDVAAAGAAQSPHFADAERREVVVVDVALALLGPIESSRCSSAVEPRVTTVMTWVWPRVKIAEP